MATTLLRIDSSLAGDDSVSSKLMGELIAGLKRDQTMTEVQRQLG